MSRTTLGLLLLVSACVARWAPAPGGLVPEPEGLHRLAGVEDEALAIDDAGPELAWPRGTFEPSAWRPTGPLAPTTFEWAPSLLSPHAGGAIVFGEADLDP